jgi:hypothetical protein
VLEQAQRVPLALDAHPRPQSVGGQRHDLARLHVAQERAPMMSNAQVSDATQ